MTFTVTHQVNLPNQFRTFLMGNCDSDVQAYIYTEYKFLLVQNVMETHGHVNSHLYKPGEMYILCPEINPF